jgi:hypothetical protein
MSLCFPQLQSRRLLSADRCAAVTPLITNPEVIAYHQAEQVPIEGYKMVALV